jgi:hypothetical protein
MTNTRYKIQTIRQDGTVHRSFDCKMERVARQTFRALADEVTTGTHDWKDVVEVALYDGDDMIDTTSKCRNCGAFEGVDDLFADEEYVRVCRACRASLAEARHGVDADDEQEAFERHAEQLSAEHAAGYNRFTAPEVEPADLFHDDSCKCPRCDPGPPIAAMDERPIHFHDDPDRISESDAMYAILDSWVNGYVGAPDDDRAAVAAAAAVAYELREIRRIMGTPPPTFLVDGGGEVTRRGVIRIGD